MKKLIVMFTAVFLMTATFAVAQAEKPAAAKSTGEKKMATHCYTMKDGAMMTCMGKSAEPMKSDVTLKNGTKVSTKGEVTMKDGKTSMLTNGQCIDMSGKVGDFDKMHPAMKKK